MANGATLKGQCLHELVERGSANAGEPIDGDTCYEGPMYLTIQEVLGCLTGLRKPGLLRAIDNNKLLAIHLPGTSCRIPAEQFCNGQVVSGIPDVLAFFTEDNQLYNSEEHQRAWFFLSTDLFHGDVDSRPIDKLRSAMANGSTQEVVQMLCRAKKSLDYGDHL